MPLDSQKKLLYNFIGQRLRALREENGLTQAEAAAMIGKSHQTYSNYEKADNLITLDSLYALAKYYGVSVKNLLPDGDLLFGDEIDPPSRRDAVHFSESDTAYETATPQSQSLRHAEELNAIFLGIKSQAMREKLLALMRTIAEESI